MGCFPRLPLCRREMLGRARQWDRRDKLMRVDPVSLQGSNLQKGGDTAQWSHTVVSDPTVWQVQGLPDQVLDFGRVVELAAAARVPAGVPLRAGPRRTVALPMVVNRSGVALRLQTGRVSRRAPGRYAHHLDGLLAYHMAPELPSHTHWRRPCRITMADLSCCSSLTSPWLPGKSWPDCLLPSYSCANLFSPLVGSCRSCHGAAA